jgi:hypothetical protein
LVSVCCQEGLPRKKYATQVLIKKHSLTHGIEMMRKAF